MTLDRMIQGGAQIAGEDGRRTVEALLELSAVEHAMAGLPQEQQDVLALACVAGLGYREAAEALGIPQGTVMSRLSRACLAQHRALTEPPSFQTGTNPHARTK